VRGARGGPPLPRELAFGLAAGMVALIAGDAINTVILTFPLILQVVPLALAVVRTDALR